MAAGEALGKRESHTPKIEIPDKIKAGESFDIRVSVGPHPNTAEHSIKWIEIYLYEEGRAFNPQSLFRAELTPGLTEPNVAIKLNLKNKGVLYAMEYCNLHGLWVSKKEFSVE
jgi:superoxide reductase